MAAERTRRNNAGTRMAGLMKDFQEDEAYNTLYGGFQEETEDKDFDDEVLSDKGSDIDFDSEEEDLEDDIQEGQDEEEEGKRKRRKPGKKFATGVKRKLEVFASAGQKRPKRTKKLEGELWESEEEDDEGNNVVLQDEDGNLQDKIDSGMNTPTMKKKKLVVAPSSRSIRDSTAAKRFEMEELELQRELRKQEAGPRKKIKYRVPSQAERLAKCVETEKQNLADLARYQKDEEENEKKKARKQKIVRGPFDICTISTTVSLPRVEDVDDTYSQNLLQDAKNLVGLSPGERFTRNTVLFRTEELFREAFPSPRTATDPLPKKICVVTGKPAKYRDPITLQFYFDREALQTIHALLYKHLLSTPASMGESAVRNYMNWYDARYGNCLRTGELSNVGRFSTEPNKILNSAAASTSSQVAS